MAPKWFDHWTTWAGLAIQKKLVEIVEVIFTDRQFGTAVTALSTSRNLLYAGTG